MSDGSGMGVEHLERLDPESRQDHLAAQHWARYEWAAQFLPAGRVLDCACGIGYGSALLRSRGASAVLGVDVSSDALDQASRRYHPPGVEFLHADALALSPEQVGQFDLIVSLETIEHLGEPQRLLDVFAALLKPGGVLALSCPNDLHLGVENPYHLWRAEFQALQSWLHARFAHVLACGEVHTHGAAIWPLADMERRVDPTLRYPVLTRVVDTLPVTAAAGFLFACSNAPLRPAAPVTAVVLAGNAYLRELEHVRDTLWTENQRLSDVWAKQNQRIQEIEQEKDRLWSELQRMGGVWDQQNARIAELDAEKNRLWEEAQRLAREWENQVSRNRELEQTRQRLMSELQQVTRRGR